MAAFDAYCTLQGILEGSVFADEPMARHTSYRIGGACDLYVECATIHDISETFSVLEAHGLPWATAGKGSNLLVSDEGFRGAIVTLGREFKGCALPESPEDGQRMVAGAGMLLSSLTQSAFKNAIEGFEFAVGIPGTLGGALFMNAGSAGEWISSRVVSVTAVRPGFGLIKYQASELDWAYRFSGIPSDEVIVECVLEAKPGHAAQIRARMEAALSRRKKTQPLAMPSAGSVFRNPEGTSAGALIEAAGLKGFSIGGAKVSEKHANFIVNTGNATAADVVAVIMEVRRRVRNEHGTELQPEIKFLGFESA